MDPRRPLPTLVIAPPAQPAREFPNLADAWAWAHAQVVEDETDTLPLSERLAANASRNLSRLMCPRRLDPQTAYLACLVPTFDVGRKAGLGLPVTSADEAALAPAWQGEPANIELPVYHHFEFSTGSAGDFESLVRRLQYQRLPSRVGRRRMAVGSLGFGLDGVAETWLAGALRTPAAPASSMPPSFRDTLRTLLNRGASYAPGQVPVLGPPVYGKWQANVAWVPNDGEAAGWLEALNLDPGHRAAAGFGILIVQDQQEELMASAWAQLTDTRRANQELRRAQLAIQIGQAICRRHLASMAAERLLQVTGPVHTRMRSAVGASMTVAQSLRREGLPVAATSTTLRRVTRAGGPLVRRLGATGSVPLVHRLYQAPLTPVPASGEGRATITQVQEALTRLQLIVASQRIATPGPAEHLLTALTAQRDYLQITQSLAGTSGPITRLAPVVEQTLDERRTALLQALDPAVTVAARARARLRLVAPGPQGVETQESASGLALLVMPAPQFPRPMYEALRDLSQDLLLPGLEFVPPETVTLLETNPPFVEAFMVGLNHEMGRELLWRGYPMDQRGTCFTHFWATASAASDQMQLKPIHLWPLDQPLGGNLVSANAAGHLVLLMRGELLRRYPGAVIYAARAASPTSLDTSMPPLLPLFRGTLKPDVTFLGFALTVDEARRNPGWFFVIEEQPTEPRFGLDLPIFTQPRPPLTTWAVLSWRHVAVDAAAFQAMDHLPVTGLPEGQTLDDLTWGRNAAHIAAITLQPAMRIAIHARALLPA